MCLKFSITSFPSLPSLSRSFPSFPCPFLSFTLPSLSLLFPLSISPLVPLSSLLLLLSLSLFPSHFLLSPSLSLILQVVYQLPTTNQWIFECLWCPRNPDIICTTSFDGHVTLYSLLGGGSTENRDTSVSELPSNVCQIIITQYHDDC